MFKPAYLNLQESGELQKRAEELISRLEKCDLCPRDCGVNRLEGEKGKCGISEKAWVSSYGPHHGEESPLRGWAGSGTIFFSGCNLNCIYCQNADISQRISGRPVSPERLAEMMLELQGRGCHNINLVSPSHVPAQAVEAISIAAQEGLRIPIVYNTGGYDSLETLRVLDGIIDIYMPDMKYDSAKIAYDLSGIEDYPQINQAALLEMHRQVGDLVLNPRGVAERGLLIRHLVLPEDLAGSEGILNFIAGRLSKNTYLNIMDQYHPAYKANTCRELTRRITSSEFTAVLKMAAALGLTRLDKRYF